MLPVRRLILPGVAMLLASIALSGCGVSGSPQGGGQPVPQPITPSSQTGTSGKTTTPVQRPPSSSTSKPSSTSTSQGKTATGSGSNAKSSSGSGSQTSPSSSSGTSTPDGSAIHLNAVTVGSTGSSAGFVAATQSIKSVQLPSDWTISSNSVGSGSTIVRMINPTDQNAEIVEVIDQQSRDIVGFYQQLPAGSGSYVVPKQIVRFVLVNPSHSYPDRGVMANLSTGGSIRIDVFLPRQDNKLADQILNSFIGTSFTT